MLFLKGFFGGMGVSFVCFLYDCKASLWCPGLAVYLPSFSFLTHS